MRSISNTARLAATALACGVAATTLLPSAAHAYWVRPSVVVVAPPPRVVYVPRPRVVYVPYPHARWVRPHYDWRGVFIPGHRI